MCSQIPNLIRVSALLVGLVIGLPGLALAQESTILNTLPVRGAQLALKPVKTVLNGLTLQWAENAMHHAAVGAYFSDEGLLLKNSDHPSQAAALSVGWKPLSGSQPKAGMVSEAFQMEPPPGFYFRLQHRW